MADKNATAEADNLSEGTTAPQGDRLIVADIPRDQDVPENKNMAPLIRNCWYVIAEMDNVNRTLQSIVVLDQPLVYYMSESGEPIVLDDRCPHRRYALSKGTLIGDSVRCGYHGFTYGKDGRCESAPGAKNRMGFGVRSYPSQVRGPWLWVWMGDPDLADPDLIPFDLDSWDTETGFLSYKLNPGNYQLLIENILDLTHIPYLHAQAGTSEEWAEPKLHSMDIPNGVGWYKNVDKEISSVKAMWTGGDPEQLVSSYTDAKQFGPGFHSSLNTYKELEGDPVPANPSLFYIGHAVTPRDLYSTHQFTVFKFSHPLVMPALELRKLFEDVIYEDDAVALRIIQENLNREDRSGRLEFGTANDRFGVKMRKILRDMKKKEMGDGSN